MLPPIALAAVVLLTSLPVSASASGANAKKEVWPSIENAVGFFFSADAPDPYVESGKRVLTHTRAWLDRAVCYFNGVGYFTFDSQSNRRLAYQISDAAGNYIYALTSPVYEVYDGGGVMNVVSAGLWRSSGQTWHFNWWGNGFNVGVDRSSSAGGRTVEEASVGADGFGGCPTVYPTRGVWNWLYRHTNGSWYYFPVTQNYTWGNSPTWWVLGNAANGGLLDFGTVSCP